MLKNFKIKQNGFAKFALLVLITFTALYFIYYMHQQTLKEDELYFVSFVYDGDTVKLSNGKKARLIGIDAPEMNYDTKNPECYAEEAKLALQNLLKNKEVQIEYDIDKKDRYGRELVYLYTTIKGKKIFVNEYMVKNGYAIEKIYAPNIKYQDILKSAEDSARLNLKGLWSVCKNI